MPTDAATHATCHRWEFLTHIQTPSASVPIQNISRGTAPRGTASVSHPHGSIPLSQRCPSTHVSRRVLVQNNRKVRQASRIDTLAFISRTTSLYLSCSLQLDLNLHVSKKGSSSKRSASYSKAAHYSRMLREGL